MIPQWTTTFPSELDKNHYVTYNNANYYESKFRVYFPLEINTVICATVTAFDNGFPFTPSTKLSNDTKTYQDTYLTFPDTHHAIVTENFKVKYMCVCK